MDWLALGEEGVKESSWAVLQEMLGLQDWYKRGKLGSGRGGLSVLTEPGSWSDVFRGISPVNSQASVGAWVDCSTGMSQLPQCPLQDPTFPFFF